MPGIMRLFVRVEGLTPFALILPSNLMPEHYVEIALKYYAEELHATRQKPELILLRRIVFKNNDQLLDFRKKSSKLKPTVPQGDQPRTQPSPLYETTHQMDIIKQEMIVTNPPMPSVVAHCETELVIKSVTLNRLILKMTDPAGSSFIEDVFFDVYRTFTTPAEVLGKLFERYNVPSLTRVGEYQRSPLDEKHYVTVQQAIKLRVVQTLERWVQKYFFDFADDALFHKLSRWVREKTDTDGIPGKILQLMRTGDRTALKYRKPVAPPGVMMRALAPSAMLSKYHPREIANQLTLLTLHIHNAIFPSELIGRQWEGPDAANVPNFIAYRDFINRLSNWVTYAVVSEKDQAVRTNNVAVLLVLCEELLKLNNWDALVAVHGGLTDPPVARLTATLAVLPAESRPLLEKFEELLSIRSASKALKAAMAAAPRPHFPSIVVHLRDISHLEDLPVASDGMINFLRCIQIHNLVRFVLDGKGSTLDFVADPEVQGVFSFWKIVDEQVLSALSFDVQGK